MRRTDFSGWPDWRVPLVAALGLLILALIYAPGVGGPFLFDDYPNIVDNPDLRLEALTPAALWQAAWSGGVTGGLGRPLAVASFVLNLHLGGGHASGFKIVNLAIHALAFLAAAFMLRQLFALLGSRVPDAAGLDPAAPVSVALSANRSGVSVCSAAPRRAALTALILALIWAVHPLDLTSVLYVVQRMTSLAGLFVFLSLGCYAKARAGGHWLYLILAVVCAGLGILAKESALLIVPFVIWLELCLVWRAGRATRGQVLLFAASAAGVAVVCLLLATEYRYLLDYGGREFTLQERLLTQLRVLCAYLRLSLVPDITAMSLFHDDVTLSRSLLAPLTTLLALGCHLALLGLAWVLRQRCTLFTFAVGFFYVGHVLESSILPLELMHEHRQYVPLLGVVLATYALASALRQALYALRARQAGADVAPDHRASPSPHSGRLALVVALGVVLAFGGLTFQRSQTWSSYGQLVATTAARQPGSERAQYEFGRWLYVRARQIQEAPYEKSEGEAAKDRALLFSHYVGQAREAMRRGIDAAPTSVLGIIGLLFVDNLEPREVDQQWLVTARQRLVHRPLRIEEAVAFIELLRCYVQTRCRQSPAQVAALGRDLLLGGMVLDGLTLPPGTSAVALSRPLAPVLAEEWLHQWVGLQKQLGQPDDARLVLRVLEAHYGPRERFAQTGRSLRE